MRFWCVYYNVKNLRPSSQSQAPLTWDQNNKHNIGHGARWEERTDSNQTFFKLLFYTYESFSACTFVNSWGGQKRAQDPLEQELQMYVSGHVNTGNVIESSVRATSALNWWAISPAPTIFFTRPLFITSRAVHLSSCLEAQPGGRGPKRSRKVVDMVMWELGWLLGSNPGFLTYQMTWSWPSDLSIFEHFPSHIGSETEDNFPLRVFGKVNGDNTSQAQRMSINQSWHWNHDLRSCLWQYTPPYEVCCVA